MNEAKKRLEELLVKSNVKKGAVLVKLKEEKRKNRKVEFKVLDSDKKIIYKEEQEGTNFIIEEEEADYKLVAIELELEDVYDDGFEITVELTVDAEEKQKIKLKGEEVMNFFLLDTLQPYKNITDEEKIKFVNDLKGVEMYYTFEGNEETIPFQVESVEDLSTITVLIGEKKEVIDYDKYIHLVHNYELNEFEKEHDFDLEETTNVVGMDGEKKTNLDLRLEEMWKKEMEMMEQYGFFCHYVFDNEGEGDTQMVNFHTHGIEETFGHKDIQIVMNLGPHVLMPIAHGIVEEIVKKGLKLEDNADKVIDNYDVELMEVEEDGRTVIRIMFPDPQGRMPSDPFCELLYKKQLKKEV